MKTEIDTNFSFDLPKNKSNVMKVMGVGGGGSNAVNHMYKQGIKGVDFVVCNTDSQALEESPVPNKIQLGVNLTEGLGAGANPEIGKLAALESYEELKNLLETQTKMLFITAGMGGGTGTGAAPIIAEMAKEFDILTVGIVTIPFNFEGKNRELQAVKGLEKLKRSVDSLIIINNNKLREVYGNLGFKEGFSKADEVLATAARGVAQVITHHYTQNIDLKDAKTVLSNSGTAIMGSSITSGSNRANEAVIKALDSPLLNDNKIEGSKNVLLLIVSGVEEITIDEIGEINEYIQKETGNSANIIMGVGEDLELGNNISVTVIATGFGDEKQNSLVSSETKKVIYTLDQDHPFEKNLIEDDEMIIDNLKIELDSIVDDNLNEESQQKKIESEINEILRNIDLSYEVVEPEFNDIELNNIELNDIEYVESEFNDYKDSNNEISFGLFSSDNYSINNIKKEEFIESGNEFVQPNEIDQDHLNNFNEVGEDEIEFIKLDLNEEVSEDLEIQDQIHVNQDNSENEIEMPENLFEKPIENDSDNENLIRRENLKQFNYVFKNKNSTIEDLEKIPAYKRMGIEINDSKSQNEDMFSKTILNEDNKLEFPDVNTYLHDNVD
ncbi:MAG: cell division protein FtsZ [Cryomorphaceae bacterium]|jgi:cell division protein FtsZ|nr:cell division protein FtsZ [Cryomorphaceae bacterium]MBT3503291.1 cell division protein FtsZ [Cryomorphaceae bacterium]MBT3689687.1 cell division protein FtsZ [Cryomorphaceae bacterium]MBT4221754.1 cell division protein FtsZ [Cryomorphaceae bacterium]MBT4293221.1 cell division protein FtsZ [Cryomorphaceae bacterium]